MAGLDRAVAAVRRAVRESLSELPAGQRILVACSGGADSMALTAAAAFEGVRAGWLVEAVVVDHGLQRDSREVAAAVAERLRTLPPFEGLNQVDVVRVAVGGRGGPEAAARTARYAALEAAASQSAIVLLGHTRDDQAETVLLGLARGSGTRSLAGMPSRQGIFRRPLLTVARSETTRACSALGIEVWSDPHNEDRRYLRSRVRHEVLPVLERELGPGVVEALARTAALAAADADLLDALADDLASRAGLSRSGTDRDLTVSVEVGPLVDAPAAVRHRVLRKAALMAGSPAGDLFATHVRALDELVTSWRGQAFVTLPGSTVARRRGSRIELHHEPRA